MTDVRLRFVVDEATMARQLAFTCFASTTGGWEGPGVAKAHDVLDRWVRVHGLACEVRSGVRWFDPHETLDFILRAATRHGDPTWFERTTAERERVELLEKGGRGPRVFVVRHERRFDPERQKDKATARWRLPRPLVREDQSATLTIEASSPWTERADHVEVKTSMPHGEIVASLRAVVSRRPVPVPVAEEDAYLAPEEGLVRVSPAIRELARDLAPPGSGPATFAEALARFFFAKMRFSPLFMADLSETDPLADVVRAGRFDCYLGSALGVALCRAAGHPARLVGGWLLYASVPSYHYWFEIREGAAWIPYDLSGGWTLAMGDASSSWSRHFFGKVDARVVTEVFPRQVTGFVGVDTPRDWYVVHERTPEGARRRLVRTADQRTLLTDTFEVLAEESAVPDVPFPATGASGSRVDA